MSSIRIVHGRATAEVEAIDLTYAEGTSVARYNPQEIIRATVQVLRATGWNDYADAIENGLDREGLVA